MIEREETLAAMCQAGREFEQALTAFGSASGDLEEVFANVELELEERMTSGLSSAADDGGFEGAYGDLKEEYAQFFEDSELTFQLRLLPGLREFAERKVQSEKEWTAGGALVKRVAKCAAMLVKRANRVYDVTETTVKAADDLLAAWEKDWEVVPLFVFDRKLLAKRWRALEAARRRVVEGERLLREKVEIMRR